MAGGVRKNADEALVAALAAGKTNAEAAVLAGVSERTLYRRRSDTAFQQRVHVAKKALVEQAVARVGDAMTEAADVLRELLAAESETVRLGAARTLLELGFKIRPAQCKVSDIIDLATQISNATMPFIPVERQSEYARRMREILQSLREKESDP